MSVMVNSMKRSAVFKVFKTDGLNLGVVKFINKVDLQPTFGLFGGCLFATCGKQQMFKTEFKHGKKHYEMLGTRAQPR